MIAGIETVVKIAADFARRLHEGMHIHRLCGRTGRKLSGQHAELQRTRGIHLFLQPHEISPHLVAKALLFQQGANACTQQNRVEGLVEVILGAKLNAPDDAVDLVERRNHDDRNVTQ